MENGAAFPQSGGILEGESEDSADPTLPVKDPSPRRFFGRTNRGRNAILWHELGVNPDVSSDGAAPQVRTCHHEKTSGGGRWSNTEGAVYASAASPLVNGANMGGGLKSG